MTFNTNQRYAARLNAFKIGAKEYWPGKNQITTSDLLERASTVKGLNAADLNYPDHFEHDTPKELSQKLTTLAWTIHETPDSFTRPFFCSGFWEGAEYGLYFRLSRIRYRKRGCGRIWWLHE